MAIDLKDSSTMGCAFFDTENGALLLCTDVLMADLDMADQLLAHIQPTTVLVPGRSPESLLTFLEAKSAAARDGKLLVAFF